MSISEVVKMVAFTTEDGGPLSGLEIWTACAVDLLGGIQALVKAEDFCLFFTGARISATSAMLSDQVYISIKHQ